MSPHGGKNLNSRNIIVSQSSPLRYNTAQPSSILIRNKDGNANFNKIRNIQFSEKDNNDKRHYQRNSDMRNSTASQVTLQSIGSRQTMK